MKELRIYEFSDSTSGEKFLVLAGGKRQPMLVKKNKLGVYYIDPHDSIAFSRQNRGPYKMGVVPLGEKIPRWWERLTKDALNYEIKLLSKYGWPLFKGVPYRILPENEISIPELLEDERRDKEAQAEYWANS